MKGKHIPITIREGIEGRDCNYCNAWHPLGEYYVNKKGIRECKRMRKDQSDRYINKKRGEDSEHFYQRKRAIVKGYRDRFRETDIKLFKMYSMLASAKIRAKKKSINFCITEQDFLGWRDLINCPIFPWIELRWDRSYQNDDSPTIDRIKNEIGYIPGNVRIVSWRANNLKRNGSKEEFLALIKDQETISK